MQPIPEYLINLAILIRYLKKYCCCRLLVIRIGVIDQPIVTEYSFWNLWAILSSIRLDCRSSFAHLIVEDGGEPKSTMLDWRIIYPLCNLCFCRHYYLAYQLQGRKDLPLRSNYPFSSSILYAFLFLWS